MDSYLEIARAVLRSSRQPMSARQILRTAHQLQLVPRDLYGRTQQKTIQARLATDILKNRSKSEFYRTGPGRFFLRALQFDRTIPHRHRREYHAPLRAAQLGRFDVVAFPRSTLEPFASGLAAPPPLARLLALPWRFVRLYGLREHGDLIPFRFRLLLVADGKIVLDDRRPAALEGDLERQTAIGIEGVVKRSDLSLFSTDGFGLKDAGVRTLFETLSLPRHVLPVLEDASRWSKAEVVIDVAEDGDVALRVFVSFSCQDVREISDAVDLRVTAQWVSTPVRVNDLSRFDRWSARLIEDTDLQSRLCA